MVDPILITRKFGARYMLRRFGNEAVPGPGVISVGGAGFAARTFSSRVVYLRYRRVRKAG